MKCCSECACEWQEAEGGGGEGKEDKKAKEKVRKYECKQRKKEGKERIFEIRGEQTTMI